MLRLGFPVIGVRDLDRAVRFWREALNLKNSEDWESTSWRTLLTLEDQPALGLMLSRSPAESKPRLHLDLFVDSIKEQRLEVARLLELGASEPGWTDYPSDPDFVVLADPDGNVFCVVDLSRAPSS